MKIDRSTLTTVQNEKLQDELFVTVTIDGTDGEDSYLNTYDSAEDAVDNGDQKGEIVATYKLVEVRNLALKRTTALVKVK